VKKFITLVGSAMSSPSMHATASGSFAFRFFTSLRQRLLGADDQPQQEFKNLLAALGSLPPSMATIGVRSSLSLAYVTSSASRVVALSLMSE
jgi:hypothetical protein